MNNRSFAKLVLKQWNVKVVDIPTSDKEESDFIASFGAHKVLIEEKTKFDDPVRIAERDRTLKTGKVHSSLVPLVRDNRLSGLITKAANQLQSSSGQEHDFRLMWFTGTGVQAEAKFHQFIATIYGTTNIVEMNSPHFKCCYFFRNSDFFRYSHIIDGAIVAHVSGSSLSVKLCLNPLSPRCNALRQSPVTKSFGAAVEDPQDMEARKEVFILDANIDRKNESALLDFLQRKYGTHPLMKLDLSYCAADVSVNSAGC